jgi:hypothetical protein
MSKIICVGGLFLLLALLIVKLTNVLNYPIFSYQKEGELVSEALRRYKEYHGGYPDHIDELSPKYLKKIHHNFEYSKHDSQYYFCYEEGDIFGQITGHCWHWNKLDGSYIEFFD